jgi:hypothetical protein
MSQAVQTLQTSQDILVSLYNAPSYLSAPEIESICDISIEPLPAAGKLLRKYAAMAVTNIFLSETSVTIYQSIRRNIPKGEMLSK